MIDRDRLTDRVTPTLLRLELQRAVRPLIMIACGCAIAIATGLYIVSHIDGGIGSTHTMRFAVDAATGVVPGRAEVRFEGIEAGLVTNVQLINRQPVLTVTVANKFGPVYRNATATLRPNTPLQDMYLDIVKRGTRSAGQAGPNDVVPASQTSTPVNIAEVLDTFQPGVRAHLYDLLAQLGAGLQDRGAYLRRTFADLAPLLIIAGRISAQLATRASDTRQLVHNTAVLANVLARRNTQLRDLVEHGTTALAALSTQNGAPLEETLHQLPRTFAALEPALTAVDRLVPHLDATITALGPTAGELPGALSSLRQLADSAAPAVRALRQPVVRLLPLAQSLNPFSVHLAAALAAISRQTGDVQHTVASVARCMTPLDEFFQWTSSVFKFKDAYGHYARGDFGFGIYTDPLVHDPQEVAAPMCAGGTTIGGVPTPRFTVR